MNRDAPADVDDKGKELIEPVRVVGLLARVG
jgi:hypothetical protein